MVIIRTIPVTFRTEVPIGSDLVQVHKQAHQKNQERVDKFVEKLSVIVASTITRTFFNESITATSEKFLLVWIYYFSWSEYVDQERLMKKVQKALRADTRAKK